MAMSIQPDKRSRFTDLSDEPVDHLLSPIKGYQDRALVSLSEAIQPVSPFFNEMDDNVFVALHNCQNPAEDLTQQESAAIHLYTMEFSGGPSLYFLLNQSLRAENREELKPWFSYLKLFLTALYKLPSKSETVWRGIRNVDLSSKYKKGTKFAWWGVSSCTTDIQILESNEFLGKHGLRTLFSIQCIHGKSVANHSYFKNIEKEIILMPGSYFEVIGQLNPAPELHIIQLKEITPPITLVKEPFPKSNTNSVSTPTVTKKNTTANALSKEMPLKSDTKWKQAGMTVAGGNGQGRQIDQLFHTSGIWMDDDDDQTIYITDCGNNRIVEWKCNGVNGKIVAGGNGQGNRTNQLKGPRDVIIDKESNSFIISDHDNRRVIRWSRQNNTKKGEILISDICCFGMVIDKNGSLYVADWETDEVRRWKKGDQKGIIVAGGNGKGKHLNQLNGPTFIFIDEEYSLYISDTENHRVMKWLKGAKEGIVVAGGHGSGNSLKQLFCPKGVFVDQLGQIYVADIGNDRVMRWCKGAKEGTVVVGGNGRGAQSNQFNGPHDLSFDRQGNLYVAEYGNERIMKFEIDL